jgi:GNAT superfamily N-acetyltransferase
VLSETNGLSYRNAVIAEASGQAASGLISYPLDDKPEPISDELPAVLVPLHELMNQALNTWYVHVLAAYPEHRGRGQGSALLAVADSFAASAGKRGLSLTVSDTNTGARRLRAQRLSRSCALQNGQRTVATPGRELGATKKRHPINVAGNSGESLLQRERTIEPMPGRLINGSRTRSRSASAP